MSSSSAPTTEVFEVEECRGVLRVFSDGSILRSSEPSFIVPVDDDGTIEFSDAVFDANLNLHLRLYRPRHRLPTDPPKLPIFYYFHGGGFCIGSRTWPNFHNYCLRLAAGLRAIIISPDYRLAPENRLPAAINDSFASILWLRSQVFSRDRNPLLKDADFSLVFISGDSAGGNIAHHIAVRFGSDLGRAELEPVSIRGFVLLMPFFGGTQRTRSEETCPREAFLNLEVNDRFWRLSLPAGSTADDPISNPFGPGGPDLREVQFGPMLVVVGGEDLLTDRAVEYAERLKEWGKPVEVVNFEGQQHGFFTIQPRSEPADKLMQSIRRFMVENGSRKTKPSPIRKRQVMSRTSSMEGFHDIGEDLQSQALVWNHILALVDTMVLKCALKLRLFDAIHSHVSSNRHISIMELATSLNLPFTRITTLGRIMRYLAHMRLVNVNCHNTTYEETYSLTIASSIYLREGSEKSHAAFVRFLIEDDMLVAMHELDTYLVKEDEVLPIERVKGEKLFEWAERDKDLSKRFDDAMTCTARPMVEAILIGYPMVFEGVKVMVDVGGGEGNVARAVAMTFPGMKCIIYDLPHVVKKEMEIEGVFYEAGNMFVSLPPADAFLLARVLQNWNDEKALEILKRCREAIVGDEGKLIIVDMIVEENDNEDMNHIKLAYDILMMTYVGGRERTENEWRSLLLQAGFSHCTIICIKALQHLIEAKP